MIRLGFVMKINWVAQQWLERLSSLRGSGAAYPEKTL